MACIDAGEDTNTCAEQWVISWENIWSLIFIIAGLLRTSSWPCPQEYQSWTCHLWTLSTLIWLILSSSTWQLSLLIFSWKVSRHFNWKNPLWIDLPGKDIWLKSFNECKLLLNFSELGILNFIFLVWKQLESTECLEQFLRTLTSDSPPETRGSPLTKSQLLPQWSSGRREIKLMLQILILPSNYKIFILRWNACFQGDV